MFIHWCTLSSFFPPISKFLQTIPPSVLGGALLCLFASIAVSGMKIIASAGFSPKNCLILALSLGLGYGVSLCAQFVALSDDGSALNYLRLVAGNPVATMFIIALLASFLIPNRYGEKEKAE